MQKTTDNGTVPVRVAMDAMGGDHGPVETVKGALAAARETNAEIILVGDQGPVEQELAKHDTTGITVSVVPSEWYWAQCSVQEGWMALLVALPSLLLAAALARCCCLAKRRRAHGAALLVHAVPVEPVPPPVPVVHPQGPRNA